MQITSMEYADGAPPSLHSNTDTSAKLQSSIIPAIEPLENSKRDSFNFAFNY